MTNLSNVDALINEQGFFTISDPAAGAGCMILASANIVEEQGYILEECMSAHVVELNKMTYHMLYIQLSLRGIAASVIHGNSLSLEVFESAYTPCAMIFSNKHGRLFDEVQKPEAPEEHKITDIHIEPITRLEQLDLFAA